jgi:hypothetical protein
MRATTQQPNMKRGVVIALVLVTAILVGSTAQAKMTIKDKVGENEIKLQIYGFSQLEMRGGDGYTSEGGVFFRAQRIRMGFNYFSGSIAGKLFIDFNQAYHKDEGGLPKAIKDAFVAYRFSNAAFVRLGMIKTPVGMSFTIPGWNLDILERQAIDKGLVLERDFGVMLSGRLIGQERYKDKKQMKTNGLEMGNERQGYGFGYDIGVFNPAGRSAAVVWDTALIGDALAYAGRVHYDHGPKLHVEGSLGLSEQAGGVDTLDYKVFDIGISSQWWDSGWEFKGEYINGTNIRGVDDWNQATLSLTVGYFVAKNFQLVLKTYQSKAEKDGVKSDLGNTYIGFNWFIGPVSSKWRDLQRHKIVVNYIVANADPDEWNGIGGLRDDAFGIGWQYKF